MGNVIEQMKGIFNKADEPFTAERAWIETTYGNGSYRTTEQRIKDKQEYIKRMIKNKFIAAGNTFSKDYRCVIDFEDDLKNHIEEIIEPFINGGFNIINLSEQIDELKDEYVYLISWKQVFETKV